MDYIFFVSGLPLLSPDLLMRAKHTELKRNFLDLQIVMISKNYGRERHFSFILKFNILKWFIGHPADTILLKGNKNPGGAE